MAPADETEVYHRMHEWYNSPERDALRAAWGAYPATPGALQAVSYTHLTLPTILRV